MDEQDKKIAALLHIPIIENEGNYTLFSNDDGTEIVFENKKHSVNGSIFYIVNLNQKVELKELVFVDSILNLISLIRSKKYNVKNNSVFIVANNPQQSLILNIRELFNLTYKYLLAYPKTVQGKIQSLKTILFFNDISDVRVINSDNHLEVMFDRKMKLIDQNISYSRLLRDFNFQKLHIHSINFGYNVCNLKYIYGYKD